MTSFPTIKQQDLPAQTAVLPSGQRLEAVDALRGFAILSIMLLHNIEHFDFYYFPEQLPEWIKAIDSVIWKVMFFLFGGKSYAIFALLFGLTYFIQFNNRQKKGFDFSGRFVWRLTLLLAFGILNSIFFQGDILAIYAAIGIVLIPVRKLPNSVVLIVAIFLMFQPVEWGKVIYSLINPALDSKEPLSWAYFNRAGQYLGEDSFIRTALGNLWNGRIGVVFWCAENGRFFQTASLFMLGMLLGRKGRFAASAVNDRFWRNALLISVIAFIPLFAIRESIPELIARETTRVPAGLIVASWSNFAFMVILVSSFMLLFRRNTGARVLGKLAPLGRMSLSNYVMQSMLGSIIYYGFGFGLYKVTGATYCLFIGIGLAIFQALFSSWWMKKHRHGPLEYIWHKATWIKV